MLPAGLHCCSSLRGQALCYRPFTRRTASAAFHRQEPAVKKRESWQSHRKVAGQCRRDASITTAETSSSNVQHYQPALPKTERNKLRAEAQRLGKGLYEATIGRNGITDTFVEGLGAALAARKLVKVRIGGSCMLDVGDAQAQLVDTLDAVCVHSIGNTFILYRQQSLPRPASGEPAYNATAFPAEEAVQSKEERKAEAREQHRAAQLASRPERDEFVVVAPPKGAPRHADDSIRGDWNLFVLAAVAAAWTHQGSAAAAEVRFEPASVSSSPRTLLVAANPAILKGLEQRNAPSPASPSQSTEQVRAGRLQEVQAQLQRVGLLVGIDQYDSARLQLRQGPASRLRRELRTAVGDYVGINSEMVTNAVQSFELLDGALKKRKPVEECRQLAQEAADSIGVVISRLDAIDTAESAAAPSHL